MGVRRIYRAASPYPDTAVRDLDFVQRLDTSYITHWDYPVYKQARYSFTDWRMSPVAFGPTINPPASISVAAFTPNTVEIKKVQHRYVATAISKTSPAQESRMSAIATCQNDLTLDQNYNQITLPALPSDTEYWVIYREYGGHWGYIGFTTGTTFRDGPPAILPITAQSPPLGDNPFNGAGKYPHRCGLFQQRLVLGKTKEVDNGVFMSRGGGDYENMDKARPVLRPDDALSFAMVADQLNEVQSFVSMKKELIVFTSDNIFSVTGGERGAAVTPGSISTEVESVRGASALPPIAINDIIFYQPSEGNEIRSMGFTFEIEGYKTDDISIFSSHLFDGKGILSWAYMKSPYSAIFAVRDDGIMLCFTWLPEQDIFGWVRIETDGWFEQVAVIPEDGYHRLYALVRRTINGQTKRFFERMALPHRDDIATACHLDCAVTEVFETAQNYVENLWHLDGATVSVVIDGNVIEDQVVTNGRIDLPFSGNIISVGLPYEGEIETLPPALMTDRGSVQNNRQIIDEVVVRTIDARGIEIGSHRDRLEQVSAETGDDLNYLDEEGTRDYKVNPESEWDDTASVIIRQRTPQPAHISAILYSLKVSGR